MNIKALQLVLTREWSESSAEELLFSFTQIIDIFAKSTQMSDRFTILIDISSNDIDLIELENSTTSGTFPCSPNSFVAQCSSWFFICFVNIENFNLIPGLWQMVNFCIQALMYFWLDFYFNCEIRFAKLLFNGLNQTIAGITNWYNTNNDKDK